MTLTERLYVSSTAICLLYSIGSSAFLMLHVADSSARVLLCGFLLLA